MRMTIMTAALVAVLGVPALVAAQPAATPQPVMDARTAQQDIKKTLGLVPTFMRAMPEAMLPGAWQAMKGLQLNPNTRVPGKYKELIGLAVAAQVPCTYCILFHTEAAKLNGATDQEIKETIGMAALTRQWSTIINGQQQDPSQFRAEFDRMIGGGQAVGGAGQAGQPEAQAPSLNMQPVADAQAARQEIRGALGMVPTFINAVPEPMVVGAWNEWKALEFNEQSALPAKYKSLISLAVAAQIPCDYCVYADKKSAIAAGATPEEINEAIGMAAITRHWSTVLNGSQIDEKQFRNETKQIMRYVQKQQGQGGGGMKR